MNSHNAHKNARVFNTKHPVLNNGFNDSDLQIQI